MLDRDKVSRIVSEYLVSYLNRYTPIVRLRVHFSRHCDFNQLSD